MINRVFNKSEITPFATLTNVHAPEDVVHALANDFATKVKSSQKKDKTGFVQDIGSVAFYGLLDRLFRMKSSINPCHFQEIEEYSLDDDERNIVVKIISEMLGMSEVVVKKMFGLGEFPFFTLYILKTKDERKIFCYDFCR